MLLMSAVIWALIVGLRYAPAVFNTDGRTNDAPRGY